MSQNCLFCSQEIRGRADKKFCDDSCRNGYNNQKNSDSNKVMRNINNRLRKNRRILEEILAKGEETKKTTKSQLQQKGFNFKYITHIYQTKQGKIYHFIYDMGYLDLGEDWFLIVKRPNEEL